jgi:hypothetical protein
MGNRNFVEREEGLGCRRVKRENGLRTAYGSLQRREGQAGATTLGGARQSVRIVSQVRIGVRLGTQLSDEQRQRQDAGDQA